VARDRVCAECEDEVCTCNRVLLPLLRAMRGVVSVYRYIGADTSNLLSVEWSKDKKMVAAVMRWPGRIGTTVVGLYCASLRYRFRPWDAVRTSNRLVKYLSKLVGDEGYRFMCVVVCDVTRGVWKLGSVNGVWIRTPERAVESMGRWFWHRVENLLSRMRHRPVSGVLVCNVYAWALISAMCRGCETCSDIKTIVMRVASGEERMSAAQLLELLRRYCVEGEELRRE